MSDHTWTPFTASAGSDPLLEEVQHWLNGRGRGCRGSDGSSV